MNTRHCDKAGKHSGRQIQAFCLEEGCRKNRLLCFFCVFESHLNHKIAYLHKELGGALSNLDQQIHVTSKERRTSQDRMEETFNKIIKACERLGRASSNKMTLIKNLINPQIQAVTKSFRKNSVDEIIKDLTSNHYISNDKLEKYAKILSFYDKYNINDVEKLEKNSMLIWETFSQLVNDAEKKIEAVFNELVASVTKFEIAGDYPEITEQLAEEIPAISPMRKPEEIIQEKIQENMQILAESLEVAIAEKNDVKVVESFKQIEENKAIQEELELIKTRKSQQKEPIQVEMEKPMEMEMVLESDAADKPKIIEVIKGAGSEMILKEKEAPLYDDNLDILSQWSPPKYLQSVVKVDRPFRKPHQSAPQVESVSIYSTTTAELNKMLARIDHRIIKSLTIKCDTVLNIINAESAYMISKMTKLTILKVYLARDLPAQLAIKMLENMYNLQELVLAEYSHLTPTLIELIKKNLNISRICFASDMEYLKNTEEMLEFLPDITQGYRFQRFWEELAFSCSQLCNLELQNPTNIKYWANYVKGAKDKLKQVTIIQTELVGKVDYTPLIVALSKCKYLEALRIEQLEFEEQGLIELIMNNPNLKVFIQSECNCISRLTYKAICEYSINLKIFSISLQDSFHGKLLFNSKNVEVFVLRGCYKIFQSYFCANLANFKKLKCLSVNFHDNMLRKESFKEISKMKHLQVLNLSNNQDINFDLINLSSLEKLDTFICINSYVSYKTVASFAFAKQLRKLSISSSSFEKPEVVDVRMLTASFPKLTHLKLVGFSKFEGDINEFNHLKSLISVVLIDFEKFQDALQMETYCAMKKISFTGTSGK